VSLLRDIRSVRLSEVIGDARAGIALAAMNIPQALGYTHIAGMPVITGLYTLLLPLLAFAALGSSRYLVVAADSATAAILAEGLAGLAPVASPQYVVLASYVALLTGVFLLLGRLLKLGFIADFVSQTVLVGFLTGVGLQVGISVLGAILGVPVHSRRTIFQLIEAIHELPGAHLPTLLVSVAVITTVLGLNRIAPKVPGTLVAVMGATVASAVWKFSAHGIATVGPVAGGLPHLSLHLPDWRAIPPLVSIAGACAIMVITQSAATSRVYAIRHQQKLDENQDLLGLAAANGAAALSGTFVVNGSPTQTAMVERSGGRSQIAQVATGCMVICVLLFFTRPLQYLPHCVLGALVLLVAVHLIDVRGLLAMRRESPDEFALALTTAVVVVGAGVEPGILLAMVLSLLRLIQHSYRPHTGVVVPDVNNTWKVVPPTPGAVTLPGFVLYRFGAALFYANAGRFAEEIIALAGSPASAVRWVIVDAEAITSIDYSASRLVAQLKKHLDEMDVTLGFARLSKYSRADFDRHHLTEAIGHSMIFDRLHDSLKAFERLGNSLFAQSSN
jgi:high affinity sulfate transporter 1